MCDENSSDSQSEERREKAQTERELGSAEQRAGDFISEDVSNNIDPENRRLGGLMAAFDGIS